MASDKVVVVDLDNANERLIAVLEEGLQQIHDQARRLQLRFLELKSEARRRQVEKGNLVPWDPVFLKARREKYGVSIVWALNKKPKYAKQRREKGVPNHSDIKKGKGIGYDMTVVRTSAPAFMHPILDACELYAAYLRSQSIGLMRIRAEIKKIHKDLLRDRDARLAIFAKFMELDQQQGLGLDRIELPPPKEVSPTTKARKRKR